MSSSILAQFTKQNYLNLETFRKNGQGVPTPVWFVEQDGLIYVRTMDGSGKVKRVRNNGRVRVAPCSARGDVKGEWVEGQARLIDAAKAEQVDRLLQKKYGLQKRLFDLFGGINKRPSATLEIQLS